MLDPRRHPVPSRPALALLGALLALAGCSESAARADDEPDSCTGRGCDTGRPPVDLDSSADLPPPGEDAALDASPGDCTPGTRFCLSPASAAICLQGNELEPLPCAAGETCRDGRCGPAEPGTCTPGTALGCDASGTAQRLCADDGQGEVVAPCPASTPFCNEGQCGAQLCTPAVRRCRGRDVLVCQADGTAEEVVESCDVFCRDGACVEGGSCESDGKNYLGCDFWAVYLDNEARGLGFGLTASNPGAQPIDVEVLLPDGSVAVSTTVAPNGLAFLDLSTATQLSGSQRVRAAYRVRATGLVTVHQFNPPNNLVEGYSNDASLLLPSTALGRRYRLMGYHSGDDLATFARLSARWYAVIVATSEGTTNVEVTSPTAIRGGDGVPTAAAGATQTYALAQGEVVALMAERNDGDDPPANDPADMTGMSIVADRAIAVFSGSQASYIPDDVAPADHVEQQLVPVEQWASEYVVPRFAPRGGEVDVFRVMTDTASTTLTTFPPIEGVNGRVLRNPGDAVEFAYAGDFVVRGSAPISVGQFMTGSLFPGFPNCTPSRPGGCVIPEEAVCGGKRIGDPAFLLPGGVSHARTDHTFLVPEGYVRNWIGVSLPTDTTITLDGVSVDAPRTPIAGTTWQVLRVEVPEGAHRLQASAPVGLSVYGYGCDVSYAYPGGLGFE